MEIFTVWVVYIHFEQIMHLKNMKDCAEIMIIVMQIIIKSLYQYNHREKLLKASFAIYADLECLLVKQQSCQNNPNEFYTERKVIHEPCGYALILVISFDSKQNKHNFYRGKDCIKRFSSDLKQLGKK